MSLDPHLNPFEGTLQLQNLGHSMSKFNKSDPRPASKIHLRGLVGSSLSFVLSAFFKSIESPLLLCFNDKEEAAYHLNDLELLLNEKDDL